MTSTDKLDLVISSSTLILGVAALWHYRRNHSDLGQRARRRVFGILLGMSLLPAGVFLSHHIGIVTWAFLVAGITTASIILIVRS